MKSIEVKKIVKIRGKWYVDVDCNLEFSRTALVEVEEMECECGQELTTKSEVEAGLCGTCIWLLDK